MSGPTEGNLNPTTPAAPSGKQNCIFQAGAPYTDSLTGLQERDITAYPPSAGTALEGAIALAGDIGGTSGTPKVVGIQGTGVATTSPTNGQVLQYSATSGLYVPATLTGAGGATGPTPQSRRWAYGASCNAGLTGSAWIGDNAGGSGTVANTGAISGAFPDLPIPTTSFNSASSSTHAALQSNMFSASAGWTLVGKNMLFQIRLALSVITSIRMRVGVGAIGSVATWIASDSLTTTAYAGFRFSTSASDSDFMCETGDGSAVNTASSGIAAAASSLVTFGIQFNDSIPNVVFSINGSPVYTSTSHLPPSGTPLSFIAAFVPLTSVSETIYIGWVYEEADS